MKLLLDTHTLIWWSIDDARLGVKARAALLEHGAEVLVSAASAYEIMLKWQLNKLPSAAALVADISGYLAAQLFAPLPISLRHAEVAGSLALDHRDPFDCMLIAQAQIEGAYLISNEALFDRFGVRRLW